MAYYITEAQFLQLQAIYSGTSATNYADIYDQIYAMIQEPDAFGTNVEGNVQAWFGAAADANRGVGGASTLIRTYTEVQLQTRYGGEISDIESVLQESSNSIADAVYVEIEASEITIDGQIYYVIPDAATIGATDALNALAPFEPYTDNAEAVWSGNILFTGLGNPDFFVENFLETPGDTYDLFLSLYSLQIAGISSIFQVFNLLGNFLAV